MAALVDLYTRPLRPDEIVLCAEEKTSLPPRPRRHATRPATPELPTRVEHASRRAGALHLVAAFDTRTGQVYGQGHARTRQHAWIAFLEDLDAAIAAPLTTSPLVGDNARAQTGQPVHAWLTAHQRCVVHFTPGHGSWLNPIEPWFSILQRKRLRIVDVASLADLQAKREQFMAAWNAAAPPFTWTTKAVAKVMADVAQVAA